MSELDADERLAPAASPSFVLADFLPYRIVVLGRAMSRALARAYENEDLTIPEWRVLAVISQASEMAARDVVAMTPMDKMAVSRAVASLEAKALVKRKSDARDKRVYALMLSSKGRAVFERVARLPGAYERRLLDGLTEQERASLKSILEKLENGAEAVGFDTAN